MSFCIDEVVDLDAVSANVVFHFPPSCRLRAKKKVDYKERNAKRSKVGDKKNNASS